MDTAQRIRQMWCGKLEGMLARHWPEAGRLTNQSGPTLTAALAHWGDPRALADDPDAAERLAKIGGHYLLMEKIDRLIESARTTVGVRMPLNALKRFGAFMDCRLGVPNDRPHGLVFIAYLAATPG